MNAVLNLVETTRSDEVRDVWNKLIDEMFTHGHTSRYLALLKDLQRLDPIAFEAWTHLMLYRPS